MLEHPALSAEGFSQVWWEFSVVTTPDMDISGIIGIGVGMQFLEQEMPWDNLVDVLGLGEIVLDKDFKIKSWDSRIMNWFDPDHSDWFGSHLLDFFSLQDFEHFSELLTSHISNDKPKCFLMNSNFGERSIFAALLSITSEGYHVLIMPKISPSHPKLQKPIISNQLVSLFSGAVFVLNRDGKLVQQNLEARDLGKVWSGTSFIEGFPLNFPKQEKRFSKLMKAIVAAQDGKSADIELALTMPNQECQYWQVMIKPIKDDFGQSEGVLIQASNITEVKAKILDLKRENERIREVALSPSHILRGPLSSMIGILELVDTGDMDKENRKLFNYLKPLTKELDSVIRQHSKKMSTFN